MKKAVDSDWGWHMKLWESCLLGRAEGEMRRKMEEEEERRRKRREGWGDG